MFERFTDRARKIMQLANQEALLLDHDYVGTEHILLGLIREGSGVGANVMKNLGVDLVKVREEVKKIVEAGPDVVTMGDLVNKLPLTPRGKKVLELAITEARDLGHNYVGTEHLLLGLLAEGGGVASQVLVNLGVQVAEVREEVLTLLGPSDPDVITKALAEAKEQNVTNFTQWLEKRKKKHQERAAQAAEPLVVHTPPDPLQSLQDVTARAEAYLDALIRVQAILDGVMRQQRPSP